MLDATANLRRHRGIAFVGNYLPRNCGIATFTHDLAEAVAQQAEPSQPVMIAAMNDTPEGYPYPERVKFEIRQDHPVDYSRAADFINFSRSNVVSLQHEYGIFGGEWGSHVLSLLRDLRCPVVTTCHTVLAEPKPEQLEVFKEIAAISSRLVVMSEKAFGFLEDVYAVPKDKVDLIPHGIHDMPFVDPSYFKDKFGLEGRRVLLTFGLLGPNKGIENMIEALPEIVAKHPKVTYLILGATHPAIVRNEGESYRLGLQRRARQLGIEDHVLFHPRFVDLEDLLEYLGATDIFVTPYLNMDQITSGALSYAMGAGKAVVSTPYWHAEELLAEGRGRIVPTGDPSALAREVTALFDDEVALSSMRKKAYLHCRPMVWSSTAGTYLQLFDEVRSHAPTVVPVAASMRRPLSAANLPSPKLDHVERLSDDTGIAHHARGPLPDWRFGYWLEDASAALVAVSKHHDIFGNTLATSLARRYLSLIQTLLSDDGELSGRLSYDRKPKEEASPMAVAKSLWGVGYAVGHGPTLLRPAAIEIFNQLLPLVGKPGPRESAYAILGMVNYLKTFGGASEVRRILRVLCGKLAASVGDEDWIERWGGQDWGVAPQALAVASEALDDESLEDVAGACASRLMEITSGGTEFARPGDNPDEEELPVSVLAFIEGLGALFHLRRDRDLLVPIRAAADWFLGANRAGVSMYEFTSGGCKDALTASGANANMGAEATVSCLIAFLTLYGLADADADPSSGN